MFFSETTSVCQINPPDRQIVALTSPKQYSIGCRKCSAQGSQFFGKKNIFFWKKTYSSKTSYGNLKCSFDNTAAKIRTHFQNFLLYCQQILEPTFFSTDCLQIVPFDKNCSFDKPVNNFSTEVILFCSKFELYGKNAVFLENVFLQNLLMEILNAVLTSTLQKI